MNLLLLQLQAVNDLAAITSYDLSLSFQGTLIYFCHPHQKPGRRLSFFTFSFRRQFYYIRLPAAAVDPVQLVIRSSTGNEMTALIADIPFFLFGISHGRAAAAGFRAGHAHRPAAHNTGIY